jgi:CBS domain-containing protein
MQVAEIMQNDVMTSTPELSISQAQKLLQTHRIRHLPVVSGTHLVGMVSDRDLRDVLPSPATSLSHGERAYQLDTMPIKTCMTKNVATVSPQTDAQQAARLLVNGYFGCLPVVVNQTLVGMVTAVDLLQACLQTEMVIPVQDIMQADPITATPWEPLSAANERVQEYRIRHLPVVEAESKLVGIITDRDIRGASASAEAHLAEYELTYILDKMTVQDAMTRDVITVRGETPAAEAIRLLIDYKFNGLPVVGDDHKLEGTITVTDVLLAYVS